MLARLRSWTAKNLPKRETFENSRLLRPVAHRVLAPHLWRFNRRSVPRGVALGTVIGILCPGLQIVLSALFALPLRANVPVAALMTFITNPFTTPPLWVAAYWLGSRILRFDRAIGGPVVDAGWLHWLWSEAGPATALGLLIITVVLATLGYAMSAIGWRWWVGHKWKRRRAAN